MFLIPKCTKYNRGIGLLEILWKVVVALIDTRICVSLQFHEVLYGFRAGRGTGTAIMELNLSQDLARLDHDILFLVFLDLRKAHDTVDRKRLIQILKRYGTGPCLCGLLENF